MVCPALVVDSEKALKQAHDNCWKGHRPVVISH